MTTRKHPRRPAMLDPAVAEEILGAEDTASSSEIAHRSAALLVGLGDDADEWDQEIEQRLIAVVNTQGVDMVAELWSHSPATTLPGILWRLYLIHQWWQRDRKTVESRFLEGMSAPRVAGAKDTGVGLEPTMKDIADILRARYEGGLADLLERCSTMLKILAAGTTFGPRWIEEDDDELADRVTRRARALLATAQELDEAARRAKIANLD